MMNHQQKKENICFVVPGIGEANPFRTIQDCADSFNKISNRIVEEKLCYKKFSYNFIPVTWHHVVQENKELLNTTNLSSISRVRNFTNTVISDILFYSDFDFQKRICLEVVQTFNELFEKNKESLKNGGKIIAIGHSLGSLIILEILTNADFNKLLNFQIDIFFSIGSPISLFLYSHTRNAAEKIELKLKCKLFYNIFDELDPIAYRIEPIFLNSPNLPPVQIQQQMNENCMNLLNTNIGTTYDYQMKCTNKSILNEKRIDYVLPKRFWTLADYICCLKSHTSYWDSYELVLFFIEKINLLFDYKE